MTLEPNVAYAIKEKDFRDYAQKWFAKELENNVDQIDDCLVKVQELKKEGDAYPQRALLPICDIISFYKFNFKGMLDYIDYEYYYRDYIEKDFIKETNLYIKNEDYRFNSNDESYDTTRIIYSDKPGDYDEWPSADFLVSEEYDDYVASVVIYALITAIAKSDLLSAAVIRVCTDRVEFEYDEYETYGKLYQNTLKIVDDLLEKTPLFSDVNYDNADTKEKNKEKINEIFPKFSEWDEKVKREQAYELLKNKYPDYPEFANKLLS